jgi:hypothetical protein
MHMTNGWIFCFPCFHCNCRQRQGAFGRVISAFDFAEVRSKGDAELLYDAKYGKRDGSGKLTPEQAAALRRRVVGTAKGEPSCWWQPCRFLLPISGNVRLDRRAENWPAE